MEGFLCLAAVASLVLLPLLPLVPKDFDQRTGEATDSQATLRKVVLVLLERRMLSIYAISILRDFAFIGFLTFLTTGIALRAGLDDTRYLGISGHICDWPFRKPRDIHGRLGVIHRW